MKSIEITGNWTVIFCSCLISNGEREEKKINFIHWIAMQCMCVCDFTFIVEAEKSIKKHFVVMFAVSFYSFMRTLWELGGGKLKNWKIQQNNFESETFSLFNFSMLS